jgi:predicted dehydrogenase
MKVAVIGCGELGSRHAQALSRHLDLEALSLVDPSTSSLLKAEQRVKATGYFGRITAHHEIASLEGTFDFIVISTSSKERAQSLEAVLEMQNSKTILLEKLLSPNRSELVRISESSHNSKVGMWVNCPMPHFSHYVEVARFLEESASDEPIIYTVKGGDLGLVSNSIHYLDHLVHLTGRPIWSARFSPDSFLIESKRAGYSELLGTLTAVTQLGDRLEVSFTDTHAEQQLTVEIRRGSSVWRFDEINLQFQYSINGILISSGEISTPMQSELTHLSLDRLKNGDKPWWSSIEQSLQIHHKLFDALEAHFGAGTSQNFT